MKQVVVILRHAPLTRVQTSEALRMALGLTLSDHRVSVLYLGKGAHGALELKPEMISQPGIQQSIEMFGGMKIRQYVEKESLEAWAIPSLRKDVERIDRAGALGMIRGADVVISF